MTLFDLLSEKELIAISSTGFKDRDVLTIQDLSFIYKYLYDDGFDSQKMYFDYDKAALILTARIK